MNLSIGIVGLPNVGKSTLFKLLTKQKVNIANYPFATIDPNIGIVPVPDDRLNSLTAISKSKKRIPAVVEFYDIAGLVRGANKGEGLGNQFLSHIREVSAILHVVRTFGKNDIIHVEGGVNPQRDLETIFMELALKDLETLGRHLQKIESDCRGGKKDAIAVREILLRTKILLEGNPTPKTWEAIHAEDRAKIQYLNFLSLKPAFVLLNGSESEILPDFRRYLDKHNMAYIAADLEIVSDVPELIRKAYEALGLVSFFTTGEDETRAWTVTRGTKAPQAAGVIHTDFEKKFIRAEVVSYEKLSEAGSWNAAKQKGWLRLEGKEYTIEDGDVLIVRHG